MDKSEVLGLIAKNPVFFLGTTEGDQPRVRGMLTYSADESGIVFHTGNMRDLYKQVVNNSKVELCFNDYKTSTQVRISGILEEIKDNTLKDEIANHPTRTFLKPWVDSMSKQEFYDSFVIYRLKGGLASVWSMAKNLEPKTYVQL